MGKEEDIPEEEVKDGWEKQEGAGLWTPLGEGDTLIGTVVKVQEGMYGSQYVIAPEGEDEQVTTPSHKVLQSRMNRVLEGDLVKIVYVREEPPAVRGQNPTKIYDVFIKRE